MKRLSMTIFAMSALGASSAVAQTAAPAANPAGSMQLSQSECTNLWQQANKDKAAGLTQMQAQPYVADFKAANPDGDTTIDQNEWMAACNKGLVKSSSSTGASGGEAGKTSDRTPGEASPARTPNAGNTGAGGTAAGQTPSGTSDRTPSK